MSIELQDVSIDFGEGPLLRQINLRIPAGESVLLIGPSGAGKTVLLKLCAGLLQPTAGRVLIAGRDLNAMSPAEQGQALLQMGMLFQKNALFDSLTVAENVAFPLREKSTLSLMEIDQRVDYFLRAVGLDHARDLFPDEISGGMQKRLGIARALALAPKMVLYDDPTAGLDPITSRRIADLIMQLKSENNATIVAVTNDMARAYQLAGRIVMVVDGELVVAGSKEETLRHPDPRVRQFVHGQLAGPLSAGTLQ